MAIRYEVMDPILATFGVTTLSPPEDTAFLEYHPESTGTYSVAMCDEAQVLLLHFLDALAEFDRLHLLFLDNYKGNDEEAAADYRRLLDEGQLRVNDTRAEFQRHQAAHGCCDAVRFDDFGAGAAN